MKTNQSGFILPMLIIATVIILGVFGYFYFNSNSPDLRKPDIVRKVEDKIDKKSKNDQINIPAEVAITKDGFMPATISIVAGQQVTFVNEDRKAHRVIAYPLSKSLPDLDSEDLQPTDSFTYSFERIGTFTLSDDMNLGKYKVTVIVN